ncbi:MAG: hypothetical protein IT359_20445 [Gemmatimonadaceae bacterium]|nr:hypothetical protein [Gemmatimonadaceae bacterium]
MLTFRRTRLAAAAACLSLAALAGAAAPALAQAPRANRTLLSINPLGLPFKLVAVEAEQKVSNIVTLGGAFSYISAFDDASYTSFDAKLRIYPNEEAFKGFAIGVSAGIARVGEDFTDGTDHSDTAPAVGVIADYNWILGKSKRVLVGTGVGAKRIFANDDDYQNANFAYPTFRFQVGMIF